MDTTFRLIIAAMRVGNVHMPAAAGIAFAYKVTVPEIKGAEGFQPFLVVMDVWDKGTEVSSHPGPGGTKPPSPCPAVYFLMT